MGTEQRRHVRVAVSIPARISILLPEQTFRPIEEDCEVLDLSERGAMINMRMSPENYSMMLLKTRYCRLDFAGAVGLPMRVTGRAVWLQPQGPESDRSYRIGLFFEDCPDGVMDMLKAFIKSVAKPSEGRL